MATAPLLLIASSSLASTNLLVNPGFEEPPILGAGQSDLAVDDQKMIRTVYLGDDNYYHAISGIADWQYAIPGDHGTASDHGLSRPTAFGDPTGPRMLFINNWDRRVSQSVSETIQVNRTYRATVVFGMPLDQDTDSKAGLFQLIAGPMDLGNPDFLASESLVLAEWRVGSAGWTGATLNQVVSGFTLVPLTLEYTAQPGDPGISKVLTVSFRTEWDSAGITLWDDATLTVVPEPAAALGFCLGMAFLARRRR